MSEPPKLRVYEIQPGEDLLDILARLDERDANETDTRYPPLLHDFQRDAAAEILRRDWRILP